MMENNLENTTQNDFDNSQKSVLDLPKMEAVLYEALHTNTLYVNLIVLCIIFLFIEAGVCVLAFTVEEVRPYWVLSVAGVAIVFGLLAWIEFKAFKFRGYALRNHDLLFREGWLWKSWTVIPFNRIQHLEINQGPIDRLFDLASLQLYTAGGASSDIEIDGLTPQRAADIKTFIMAQNTTLKQNESEPAI
ncbi:MAG: PH domain-containing protein [Saprospiraceae bacterium]|nr:PH domain-containing protein [Saprospiraceae bacterium]